MKRCWILLAAVASLSGVSAQLNWCGYPECPPEPKCAESKLDLMMVLDHSGSMQDKYSGRPCPNCWPKEKEFAVKLATQASALFNVTRFGAVKFGAKGEEREKWAQLVYRIDSAGSLTQRIAGLTKSLDELPGPDGGTPTDQGLKTGREELARAKLEGVTQILVIISDGVPTRCETGKDLIPNFDPDDAGCILGDSRNDTRAAAKPHTIKQAELVQNNGVLLMSIGVTTDLSTGAGQEGQVTMREMASNPKELFGMPDVKDFDELIKDTLPRILDLLCFYSVQVDKKCVIPNDVLTVTGYNFINIGLSTPQCRFNTEGKEDYVTEDATITSDPTSLNRGQAKCNVPTGFNVGTRMIVEVSRDGNVFTGNGQVVIFKDDCSTLPPTPFPKIGGRPSGGGGGDEVEDTSSAGSLSPCSLVMAAGLALLPIVLW